MRLSLSEMYLKYSRTSVDIAKVNDILFFELNREFDRLYF